tara:strand:+ start:295 stop:507 length:213 start_codon:yes stop_codon:yes gene_type:complete
MMDELDRLREKFDESHKLIMRILDFAEYANGEELKKLNKILDEAKIPIKDDIRKEYKEIFDGTASQLESV